jgi:hypothetical protein
MDVRDLESPSSVYVPPTGLFYEPFLLDLELFWNVYSNVISLNKRI